MNSRKKKHFLLLISLILTILLTTSPVLGGGVVGSGTSGSCTESALNAALSGGGSVTFNCGGSHTITFTSQKTITANTVIDGGGVITFSGGNSTRLFSVENGASLTLQNVVLTKRPFHPKRRGPLHRTAQHSYHHKQHV